MKQIKLLLLLASASVTGALAQSNGLTDMSQSRFAKMANTGISAVHWTDGFWGDRFQVFSRTSLQSKIGRASCRKECRSRWSPYH